MPAYIDLSTIHTPAVNAPPPASWGLQARDNMETLARPPRCRVRRATDLSCLTGAQTAVPWTTADYDAGFDGATAHWVAATPTRINIRRTGMYLVSGQGLLSANGVGTRSAHFMVNGAASLRVANYAAGSSAVVYAGNIAGEIPLTSGDYLEYTFFQDSGSTLTLLGAAFYLSAAIRWLGPL